MTEISELIKKRITEALQPDILELIDDSQAHAGHAGTSSGAGHYNLTVVAKVFEGKSLVQRHQLVYQAVGDLMKNEIHALGINALSPSENR